MDGLPLPWWPIKRGKAGRSSIGHLHNTQFYISNEEECKTFLNACQKCKALKISYRFSFIIRRKSGCMYFRSVCQIYGLGQDNLPVSRTRIFRTFPTVYVSVGQTGWSPDFDLHFGGIIADPIRAFVQLVFGNDNNVRTVLARCHTAIGTSLGLEDQENHDNSDKGDNETNDDPRQYNDKGNWIWN